MKRSENGIKKRTTFQYVSIRFFVNFQYVFQILSIKTYYVSIRFNTFFRQLPIRFWNELQYVFFFVIRFWIRLNTFQYVFSIRFSVRFFNTFFQYVSLRFNTFFQYVSIRFSIRFFNTFSQYVSIRFWIRFNTFLNTFFFYVYFKSAGM